MTTIRIHPDVTAGRKNYEHLPKDTLLVHGTFLTFQGEGPFMGRKAFFIRLAGCNYGSKTTHCGGPGLQCDTEFTLAKGVPTSVQSLVEQAVASGAEIVVVTGGEPFLQAVGLMELSLNLFDVGLTTQVETNGVYIRAIEDLLRDPSFDTHVVISPKANQSSGYSDTLIRKVYAAMNDAHRSLFLKVLIGAYPYDSIPAPFLSLPKHIKNRIYLSPVTTYKSSYTGEIANSWNHDLVDPVQTAANHACAAQLVIEHNLRLSIQMHNFCGVA